jgi:3-phenylpropionate/trans-cinnamate dioxygenase ferredoxin subunit
MAGFVTVGESTSVVEGEVTGFMVGDLQVGATRLDGVVHAFADVCTHRKCNFSMGCDLEGPELTCECHGAVFDLRTGEVLAPPATERLPVYPAREVDGQVQIEV